MDSTTNEVITLDIVALTGTSEWWSCIVDDISAARSLAWPTSRKIGLQQARNRVGCRENPTP